MIRYPRHRYLTLGLVAGLTAATLSCTAAPTPLGQTLVCDSSRSTNSAANVQALFNHFHNAAWGGGDGGAGVALPDGRMLLTFGDTFQDPTGINPNGSRKPDNTFRHNSMMLIGGHCLGALMGPGFSEPLPGNSDGTYYWPGQAAVVQRSGNAAGDRVWVPAARVRLAPGGFGFQIVGSDLFAFDLKPGATPVPAGKFAGPSLAATQNVQFDSGTYVNGGYLYLYGGRHAPNTYFASNIYLARVPVGSVSTLSSWDYYAGNNAWTKTIGSATVLAGPDASGSGPSGGIYASPFPGGVGWIGKPDEYTGPGLQAWSGTSVAQVPYARTGTLYSAPSDNRIFQYGGAGFPGHPMASGRELVDWSRNSFQIRDLFTDANFYMPQWAEISAPVAGIPSGAVRRFAPVDQHGPARPTPRGLALLRR